MSTIKVDSIQNTSGVEQFTAKAWVQFELHGTAGIQDSGGVSSLTDQGVGDPLFTLTDALPAARGATWLNCALWGDGSAYPVQSGSYINSTTTWVGYCGSSTITRDDWDLGYSGLLR